MPQHFYRPAGDGRYESTEHAVGVWTPSEQHMGAATGLLLHELDRIPGGEGKRLARVSLDIIGRIPVGDCEILTRVARPGKRIELVEAEWLADGRTSLVARGWRVETVDTSAAAGVEDAAMPGPDEAEPSGFMDAWEGGFVRAFEFRALPGMRPGAGSAWVRTGVGLVEGVAPSPLAAALAGVDLANGLVPRFAPDAKAWGHPNLDLQLHLHRAPSAGWLGLDVRQTFGDDGIGLTSAVLHDGDGPFGRAEMILMVRPIG
ncbi:MAG: thioesterase family protein [Microbacteriaceae bacterium]|nr:thioesterase family protein [Microbacteriaceae bacterium]